MRRVRRIILADARIASRRDGLKSDLRLSSAVRNNNLEHVYVLPSLGVFDDNPRKWQITKPNSRG